MYSRDTQKLMYWLISDFANFWNGKEVGSTPTEYETYKAKQLLKKDYIKATGVKIPKEPLNEFIEALEGKDNKSIEELKDGFIKAIKLFLLKNNDFSLSLEMMSQENANRFVKYLFDLAFDNEVPLKKEIIDLYSQEQQRNFVFTMLLKKKCVVCGQYADLDHWDNVAQIGGYEHDDGRKLRYLPLCREHHTEKHNIGRDAFKNKYHIEGIHFKNDEEIKMMKEKYKGHFKAFKEGE